MSTRDLDDRALATHYVNICNTALSRGESPAGKTFLELLSRLNEERRIVLEVLDGEQDDQPSRFQTFFADGQFWPLERLEEPTADEDLMMSFTRAQLAEMVDHADEYISAPSKLGWDWLSETLNR